MIVNASGVKYTAVVAVCALPEIPLRTLIMFWTSKTFKTDSVSVPIPMLLPIEIFSGIVET